jgi:hypothetical protein
VYTKILPTQIILGQKLGAGAQIDQDLAGKVASSAESA